MLGESLVNTDFRGARTARLGGVVGTLLLLFGLAGCTGEVAGGRTGGEGGGPRDGGVEIRGEGVAGEGQGSEGGGRTDASGGGADASGDAGGAAPDGLRPPFDPKEMVERLSGAKPLSGTTVLAARHTAEQRKLAREYLVAAFGEIGLPGRLHDYTAGARGPGANVYAELPATDGGSEWVLLGAHYDSVTDSPGANDNATGVALVCAVADHLVRQAKRSRSFLFVLFDQEEFDAATKTFQVGSGRFASHLLTLMRTVHSVHTADQLGWDKDGDRAVELEKPTTALRVLYEAAAKPLGIPTRVTNQEGSDHQAFRLKGFSALGITEEYGAGDTTPHQHKTTNTASTVDFAYLDSCVGLVRSVMGGLL